MKLFKKMRAKLRLGPKLKHFKMQKHRIYLVIDNDDTLDIYYNFINRATERQRRNIETKQVIEGQCNVVEGYFHNFEEFSEYHENH